MPTMHYQSARGVYFDIKHSHFKCQVNEDMTFYFTSENNLNKFESQYKEEIKEFKKKVETIYWNNHSLQFDELGLVRLYLRCEKRGFRLNYKGIEIDCPDRITFKTVLNVN